MRPLEVVALLSTALAGILCQPVHAQTASQSAPVSGLSSLFERVSQLDVLPVGLGAPSDAGPELLHRLHETAQRGHKELGYGEARHHMFSRVDNVLRNGVRGVGACYSGVFVPGTSGRGSDYPERGDLNGDGFVDSDGMNAEHVWPQSYFKQRGPMRSDLHHLLPSFMHPNSMRGRLPFGEVSRADADYSTTAGAKRGGGRFEPPDAMKGRVARAMLYFYTRYLGYNILPSSFVEGFWNNRIELFLRWNREFPPTEQELRRNDAVEAVQGNRNPFVDDPGLADRIGSHAFRMTPSNRLYSAAKVDRAFRTLPR